VPAIEPNEFELFDNVEVLRDGNALSRLGAKKLNNAALTPTAQITGIGHGQSATPPANPGLPPPIPQYTVVARDNATWYYTNYPFGTPPIAFSTISAGAIGQGSAKVNMETAEATGNLIKTYFASRSFAGLLSWAGPGKPLVAVPGSPVASYIKYFGGSLFAAGMTGSQAAPYQLAFADPGNPDSWPQTSILQLLASSGPITGLVAIPTGLLIFCQWSIQMFQGIPSTTPGAFAITPLNDHIGCDLPGSISEDGGIVYFSFQGDIYSFAGTETIETSKLRGLTAYNGGVTIQNNGNGILTPWCYAFRPMMNTSPLASPAATAGLPNRMFMQDRTRFKQWTDWVHPVASDLGASNPVQPLLYWPGSNYVVLNGGDGNLYYQPFRVMQAADVEGTGGISNTLFTNDDTGQPVVGHIRTGQLVMGSPGLVKEARRLIVTGFCTPRTANVALIIVDEAGTTWTTNYVTNDTIPLVTDLPTVDGSVSAAPSEFSAIRIDVQAAGMLLQAIDFEWAPRRYYAGGPLL